MKTNVNILLLLFTLVSSVDPLQAQTGVGLQIQPYAGLSITGQVGRVYQVQYARELPELNKWYALQHFELKWNPHEFVDTTCPATEKRFYRAVEVEVPKSVVPVANMVFIAPGTFIMGSPPEEPIREDLEGPRTEVTISRGFWMGKHEVTQGEYLELVGTNPSYFRTGTPAYGDGSGSPVTNELQHPVEQVSWYDATNYCQLLTERERTAGRLPDGYGYRLPTEAEWEYACRAGTTSPYHYGDALRSTMVNFDGRAEYPPCGDEDYCFNPEGVFVGLTTEVGGYQPNAWGLYDMHGNVWELCMDWLGDYSGGSVADPQGPETGSLRVTRGGSAGVLARACRSAQRGRQDPASIAFDVGFRVVLAAVP